MAIYKMDLALQPEEFTNTLQELEDRPSRPLPKEFDRKFYLATAAALLAFVIFGIAGFIPEKIRIGNLSSQTVFYIIICLELAVPIIYNCCMHHVRSSYHSLGKEMGLFIILSAIQKKQASHVWVDEANHTCTIACENLDKVMPTVITFQADPIITREAPSIADNAVIADINTEKDCMSLTVTACYPEPDMQEWLNDHGITLAIMRMQRRWLWKNGTRFARGKHTS